MFKLFSRKHLERVKHVWGAGRVWGGSSIQHWLQLPLVQDRINLKAVKATWSRELPKFLQGGKRADTTVAAAVKMRSEGGEGGTTKKSCEPIRERAVEKCEWQARKV